MPSRVKGYTSSSAVSLSGSLVDLLENTSVMMTQTTTAMSVSTPRILKNVPKLSQLIRRSIPTSRITAAMKISGIAALEAANFLITFAKPDSCAAGALLVVLREEFEREDDLEELFFEPLEEEPDVRLPVFAIISRYLLFP